MTVVLSNDKGGFKLKEAVLKMLLEEGYDVIDLGTKQESETLAHTKAGALVAEKIQSKEADRGILFCGTGMGVSLAANKFKGISAAVCESVFSASHCRMINNCNVLCMGAYILGEVMAVAMAKAFMNSNFADGEFGEAKRRAFLQTQIDAIAEYESANFK